jgi:hypothetical protein
MTLVVVPFCAMLAPCSMLSRTPRAGPKERGAGSKIPLDNPSPIQGLELANVESRRLPSHGARPEPSGKRLNSGHARIPVRPQRVVKMTFASSSPPTPAMQSSLRDVISGHGRTVGIPAGLCYNLINRVADTSRGGMHARNSDRCNHICRFIPVKRWRARRLMVRELRHRSRHELRLLFVPTMPGNDFRQRWALPTKFIRLGLRLYGATAATLSARPLNCGDRRGQSDCYG